MRLLELPGPPRGKVVRLALFLRLRFRRAPAVAAAVAPTAVLDFGEAVPVARPKGHKGVCVCMYVYVYVHVYVYVYGYVYVYVYGYVYVYVFLLMRMYS